MAAPFPPTSATIRPLQRSAALPASGSLRVLRHAGAQNCSCACSCKGNLLPGFAVSLLSMPTSPGHGLSLCCLQGEQSPVHYIHCSVTPTWTRVGMHAFLQGIPVFLRSIAALVNHRPVKDIPMRYFILSVKFHGPGMLPARAATGRPAPYAVSAARPGVQTNHLPKSPSPVVWPAAVSPE